MVLTGPKLWARQRSGLAARPTGARDCLGLAGSGQLSVGGRLLLRLLLRLFHQPELGLPVPTFRAPLLGNAHQLVSGRTSEGGQQVALAVPATLEAGRQESLRLSARQLSPGQRHQMRTLPLQLELRLALGPAVQQTGGAHAKGWRRAAGRLLNERLACSRVAQLGTGGALGIVQPEHSGAVVQVAQVDATRLASLRLAAATLSLPLGLPLFRMGPHQCSTGGRQFADGSHGTIGVRSGGLVVGVAVDAGAGGLLVARRLGSPPAAPADKLVQVGLETGAHETVDQWVETTVAHAKPVEEEITAIVNVVADRAVLEHSHRGEQEGHQREGLNGEPGDHECDQDNEKHSD